MTSTEAAPNSNEYAVLVLKAPTANAKMVLIGEILGVYEPEAIRYSPQYQCFYAARLQQCSRTQLLSAPVRLQVLGSVFRDKQLLLA